MVVNLEAHLHETTLMRMLLILLLFAGNPAIAHDYGEHESVSPATRQWFRDLRSPETSIQCCDVSDCLRTEAHVSQNRWKARAPDGSWLIVPPTRVITDRGNPVGEPILCAVNKGEGSWLVLCFVPGALL
jgi:hypothetical protein